MYGAAVFVYPGSAVTPKHGPTFHSTTLTTAKSVRVLVKVLGNELQGTTFALFAFVLARVLIF